MEEKEKNQKSKVIIGGALLLLLVMTIIGVTYAAFTFSKVGTTENAITTGAVTMIYTEGNNQITINNAMPMTEEVGKALSDENYVFDFTVDIKTGPKMPISYEVTAVKDASSTLENDDVRLYLQKSLDGMNYDNEVLEPSPYIPLEKDDEFGAKAGEMSMDVGTVSEKVIYYYRLRMWVDSSYELSSESKFFTVRVNVYGKDGGYSNVKEGEPNPPELIGDMIPVIYDNVNSSWIKSSTKRGEWFDYSNQTWANAVTIKDSTKRATYKSAAVGTPIPIEDINTFMVWIPRYSYTLGNEYGYKIGEASTPSQATPGAFDIKFVGKNTTEMGSGQYTGDTPENYFTPSSFCWGDTCDDEATRKDSTNKELSGIWVSKFEITGMVDSVSLIPDYSTLAYSISDYFTKIQTTMNGESGLTNYGFSGNYDTHMIKNTEWGAFAYLSQSKYGQYGNSVLDSKTYKYYSINYFPEFSTTGNMSGIMRRAGAGNSDLVMGNYNNIITVYVNFDTMPDRRYYNLYTDNISSIKGDTMFGTDYIGFYGTNYRPDASYPWVVCFDNSSSSTTVKWLFRVVGTNGGKNSSQRTRFVLISNE